MKTIITLVLLIALSLNQIITAQTEPKTYYEKMKVLMSELDTTNFKNNILYNRVYPLAGLTTFNQNERKDTSNYKHFSQAIHEIHLASNKQSILSVDLLEQIVLSAKFQNQVIVGVINMDITTIEQDAYDYSDRKIEIDSSNSIKRLIEMPDKSPYKHIQSLIISPLLGSVKQINSSDITFDFLKAFLQESENPIKELNVDFGDGQTQPIIESNSFVNNTLSHSFSSEGIKTLKFTGSYQNGETFETYAMINIAIITPIIDVVKLRATENFTPYIPDEEDAYYNYVAEDELPEIEYKIYYSTDPPRTQIMKPIIIVDGIDYDDERDCDFLFYEQLKLNDTGQRLGEKLQEDGYDVIIANFPNYKIGTATYYNSSTGQQYVIDIFRKGGADYIQRNAKSVKELIRNVNDKLSVNGSSEELIVVGPSMGGLVTR